MLACVCHPSRAHNLPRPLEPVHRARHHTPPSHHTTTATIHPAYSTSVFGFVSNSWDECTTCDSCTIENGLWDSNQCQGECGPLKNKRTNVNILDNYNNNNEKTLDKNDNREKKERTVEAKDETHETSPTMKSKTTLERKKSVDNGKSWSSKSQCGQEAGHASTSSSPNVSKVSSTTLG